MTDYPVDRPVVLELGPGRGRKLGSVLAMDLNPTGYIMPEIVLNIGFEAFPLANNSIDKVVAWNMLEHLPKSVHIPVHKINSPGYSVYKNSITEGNCPEAFEKYEEVNTDMFDFDFLVHRPIIYTFEEVWRVLKPEGIFEIGNPAFPSFAAIGDSTHLSLWCESCINYYCLQDPIYDARYRFECVENKCNQTDFVVKFKKIDEPLVQYQKPKNIWRPKPVDPEDYYKLTLEKVEFLCRQCGWKWDEEKKEYVLNR